MIYSIDVHNFTQKTRKWVELSSFVVIIQNNKSIQNTTSNNPQKFLRKIHLWFMIKINNILKHFNKTEN